MVGELKKIPPVLEYLLDSVRHAWSMIHFNSESVGQERSNYTNRLISFKVREILAFGK